MIHHRDKFIGENAIAANTRKFEEQKGLEPSFMLTPTGAQKLKEFLILHATALKDSHAIPAPLLRQFLDEIGFSKTNIGKLETSDLYALFGAACEGYNERHVKIDPRAVSALADAKKIVR